MVVVDIAMPNGSSSSSSRTTPLAPDTDHQTELTNGDLHIQSKAIISPSDESRVVSSDPLCEGSDQAELSTSADSSQVTQKPSRSDDVREASLTAENSDAELDGAFSSIVTQGCKIDHLQQIIEDAKSNKVC